MQATPETLTVLSKYLADTLSHDTAVRRAAEASLTQAEEQPGFLLLVLHLVSSPNSDKVVRQAGGVLFKNAVKRLWEPEDRDESPISEQDKQAIKSKLVPLMIELGTPQTANLQSQIGEGLSTIASVDFPEKWEGLVDVSARRYS
jgi:exportin-2 (importin alpha re-exporter)